MLLISKTFEVITEESASEGDADSRGYEWQDVPHTVRELADTLNTHGMPWAHDYYVKRNGMSQKEFRLWAKANYRKGV